VRTGSKGRSARQALVHGIVPLPVVFSV